MLYLGVGVLVRGFFFLGLVLCGLRLGMCDLALRRAARAVGFRSCNWVSPHCVFVVVDGKGHLCAMWISVAQRVWVQWSTQSFRDIK